jgi:hypothetical protein
LAGSEIDHALNRVQSSKKQANEVSAYNQKPHFEVLPDQTPVLKQAIAPLNQGNSNNQPLPVVMLYEKLKEIMSEHDHRLSPEAIKSLPRVLLEPAAIFKSRTDPKTGFSSLIFLTDKTVNKGGVKLPLVVALHLDGGKLKRTDGYTLLASAYPKDDPHKAFQKWIADPKTDLIFTNPQKIETLNRYGISLIDKQGLNIERHTPEKSPEGLVMVVSQQIEAPTLEPIREVKKQDIDFSM